MLSIRRWVLGRVVQDIDLVPGSVKLGKAIALAFIVFPFLSGSLAIGGTIIPGFVETSVADYWEGAVGITFDKTGTLYQWDRDGRVWVIEGGSRLPVPLIDISEEVGSWRDHGMLGFALDPNFRQNGFIYLSYVVDHHYLANYGTPNYDPSKNEYNQATIGRITRYRARASDQFHSVDPSSRTILVGESASTGFPIAYDTHGVGSLVFGRDGTLFASCGEASELSDYGSDPSSFFQQALDEGILKPKENVGAFRSQLVDTLSGKVIRIDPANGNGVPGNPFYDNNQPRAPRSRVWALGLRQPFRMTIRPNTGSTNRSDADPGVLYIGDVGYFTWEKLVVATGPAMNFGWPIYEGYDTPSSYDGVDRPNFDAPNPLFGTGGCTQQYFGFRDLLKEATLGTPSWPNPCAPSQQIPNSIQKFTHARPALDWQHSATGPSRVGVFIGQTAAVQNIGDPGSPVSGPQFGGNCSVAGTWYQGDDFPPSYKNTYFHADYAAGWIRNFTFDSSNRLVSVRDFASGVAGIVGMATHPIDGAVYYVNLYNGIHKISYGGNVPPVAVAVVDRTFGSTPLTVQFDASGSSDPDGGDISYRWNFGDGTPDSTEVSPGHTFVAPAGVPTRYLATLTVTDSVGASNSTTVKIAVNDTPPSVVITSPVDGSKYPLTGETSYPLSANVSDAESSDAELTYQWQTVLHHNNHTHPEPINTNHFGTTVLSPFGCDGDTYHYRITLVVTDPSGLSSTSAVELYPDCPNTPPVISPLSNQKIAPNFSTGPIPFTIGDAETRASNLVITATSSNEEILPSSNLVLGGSESNRTINVIALAQTGTSQVSIVVSDGLASVTGSFNVTIATNDSYLFSENFEGAGFQNSGWTKTGAPDEDFTALPLEGLESLRCNGGQRVFREFPFPDVFYLYFKMRFQAFPSFQVLMDWRDEGLNTAVEMYCNEQAITLSHGRVSSSTQTLFTTNVTYDIWIEWSHGTGSNGVLNMFVATNGIKPGAPDLLINAGTGGAVDRWTLGPESSGSVIFDQIIVSDSAIGSNPGDRLRQPPSLVAPPDQVAFVDAPLAALPFVVDDSDTPLDELALSGSSSNPALLPDQAIIFGGNGSNRTVTLQPIPHQLGTADITLRVDDGFLSASNTFTLNIVSRPRVNASRSDRDLLIGFDTLIGKHYVIEHAESIDAAVWAQVRFVSGTGNPNIIDVGLMGEGEGFYRLRCLD